MSVTAIDLDRFSQATYTGATHEWYTLISSGSRYLDGNLHGYKPSNGLPAAGALIKAWDATRDTLAVAETPPSGETFSTIKVLVHVHGNEGGTTPIVLKQIVVDVGAGSTGAIVLDETLVHDTTFEYLLTTAELATLGVADETDITDLAVTARIWSGQEEGGGQYARIDYLGAEIVWSEGVMPVVPNREEEFYMDGWNAGKNGGWEVLARETITVSNTSLQIFANCPAKCSRITITPKTYDVGLLFNTTTIVAATAANTHKYDADVRAELYANQETFKNMRAYRLEGTDADVVITYWG